jgi:hypothetical protein
LAGCCRIDVFPVSAPSATGGERQLHLCDSLGFGLARPCWSRTLGRRAGVPTNSRHPFVQNPQYPRERIRILHPESRLHSSQFRPLRFRFWSEPMAPHLRSNANIASSKSKPKSIPDHAAHPDGSRSERSIAAPLPIRIWFARGTSASSLT